MLFHTQNTSGELIKRLISESVGSQEHEAISTLKEPSLDYDPSRTLNGTLEAQITQCMSKKTPRWPHACPLVLCGWAFGFFTVRWTCTVSTGRCQVIHRLLRVGWTVRKHKMTFCKYKSIILGLRMAGKCSVCFQLLWWCAKSLRIERLLCIYDQISAVSAWPHHGAVLQSASPLVWGPQWIHFQRQLGVRSPASASRDDDDAVVRPGLQAARRGLWGEQREDIIHLPCACRRRRGAPPWRRGQSAHPERRRRRRKEEAAAAPDSQQRPETQELG